MKFKAFLFVMILSTVLFFSVPAVAWSQESVNCAESLQTAQSLFDRGQVEKVPGILAGCMRSGFKREEQLTAYKLLVQTYLFEDKIAQADSTMLEFLRKYPEYQLSPTDHSSFIFLFKNFYVNPVIQFALHLGTNLPFLTMIGSETLSAEEVSADYSTDAFNLFASFEVKYALNEKLEINLEAGYSQLSYKCLENFNTFGLVSYSEVLHRIEIPLTVTYKVADFGNGKFTAYIRAGAGPAFNLSASAKSLSWEDNEGISFTPQTAPQINRNDSRIKMDLFAQAGGGIKYKIPKGYLNFEIRTNLGLYNQVVRGGDSAARVAGYYFKDDNFNLNDLNFNLGYTFILYKPKKR